MKFLAQGTLYPDVIECGNKTAAKIKSHHNLIPFPEGVHFELIEPLKALFKDEVRAVGAELGLPDHIVHRQPFPGPGLAVRIIGDITHEKLELLRLADAIVREEIGAWDTDREVWQYFAVLPDIRSVGVMGDERTYGHPIIIRAVASADAMTADWARLPHELLAKMSNRIINEVDGHQPRGLRHHEQASRHHRVGVARASGRAAPGSRPIGSAPFCACGDPQASCG